MEETTKREILRLRRQGATYPEIGNIVGYSIKSIQKVIGEKAPELAKMSLPRVPIEVRRAVAKDYYLNGLTANECMVKHEIGARAMNAVRVQFRDEYGGKKATGRRQKFTEELVEEIRDAYANGETVRGLYEMYGVTRSALRRFGITKQND